MFPDLLRHTSLAIAVVQPDSPTTPTFKHFALMTAAPFNPKGKYRKMKSFFIIGLIMKIDFKRGES